MKRTLRTIIHVLFFAYITIVSIVNIRPCDIPVFRYALERWPADSFQVYVLYRGSLSPDAQELVNWLDERSHRHISFSNYNLHVLDLADETNQAIAAWFENESETELPALIVRFPPHTGIQTNILYTSLSAKTVQSIPDSPIRHEIAKRLLNGDSAVWVLLQSGKREKDESAARLLDEQLKKMEDQLQLPETVVALANDLGEENGAASGLRIHFSSIHLSKTDAAEQLFLHTLMQSESDLHEYANEPMVFPIYGRGRILYALVGAGIDDRNVLEAGAFITGPCSCEVKDLNPGLDMLIAVDWDGALEERFVDRIEEAFLLGTEPLKAEPPIEESEGEERIPLFTSLFRNLLLAVGILLVLNGVIAYKVLRKKTRMN
ncbi:MAG: hypothetical protein C4527_27600 [Candidatus Omnitrophota bacterium]|jgi:hypothetical protein|nr:MAG: hypothetical protein C4527_27600 [Candidatus Omnitrophota bacterium]